ncbi:MAG: trypsin-like peptidase domain-containing protein [Planctomycetes bacterium]|nr:trypsin-like peptidase domain-containing protein [Planctomycetota bacterium]
MRHPRHRLAIAFGSLLCVAAICTPVLATDSAVMQAQQQRIDIVHKVAASVVAIFSSDGGGGGSGVLITADGYALTNFHVTSACGDFMKCGLNDGRLYDAVIVGIDPTGDVALVKLLGRDDFPHATLGDSDKLAVGDWTYAMGNPFLLATDFQPTVTAGIVSGLHRYQYPAGTLLEYTDCIQVDTSINPGNSGGPLFNTAGELVGINGRISVEKRGRVNVGAGYAISINQIKHFMDYLRGGHVVDHATLGATVRSGSDREVVVDSILDLSAAYRRGLREDDEIVSFAGRPIGSVNQFKNILGIYPKGWSLPLVYRRDGRKQEIIVELRALHRESELKPKQPQAPRGKPKPAPDDLNPHKSAKLPKEELPDEYKKMFVKKAGYANYYFNLQEQQRVLGGLANLQSWRSATGRWKLTGRTTMGEEFALSLSEKALGLQLPNRPGLQSLDSGDFLDEPPGSGGLLAALYQFKLLLTKGTDAFTEFQYVGSQPLEGRNVQVDVLLTRKAGVETSWYFRKADGAFVGFDTRLGNDVDPCEVRFLDYGDFAGKRFPSRFSVRHADVDFATFEVLTLEVLDEKKPEAGNRN